MRSTSLRVRAAQECYMLLEAPGAMTKITRRKFLGLTALALPAALGVDARFIEPTSLRVTKFNLARRGRLPLRPFHRLPPQRRRELRGEVVRTINELAPEFVCFTGDLVEDARFATEALGFIQQIRAPVYGSPGKSRLLERRFFSGIRTRVRGDRRRLAGRSHDRPSETRSRTGGDGAARHPCFHRATRRPADCC